MKFLYKIYSAYDGFTPKRIPERLLRGNVLRLGWDRYIDLVEVGTEVWIYFHGPHSFEPGVYLKGIVQALYPSVTLRVREFSINSPLTDRKTSEQVAAVVSPRYRQVFLLPEEWEASPICTIGTIASSCAKRQCGSCPTWKSLPIVKLDSYQAPPRLNNKVQSFIPAYWVIPSRCYLHSSVARPIRNTTEIWSRFKVGEKALAYPLALGMFEALRKRNLVDFDSIVPIPLSPDKVSMGEEHRTLLLASELSRLLGTPVMEVLSLTKPMSKRIMRSEGVTAAQFEKLYYDSLRLEGESGMSGKVLLVDDVCTWGSTLSVGARKILDSVPACTVVGVTAGQMILKQVVVDDTLLVTE